MNTFVLAVFILSAAMLPTTSFAQTQVFEGTKVLAAGFINPPNLVEGCDNAKQDAIDKAIKAGYKSTATWERQSVDSDFKLKTERIGRLGSYFIFSEKVRFLNKDQENILFATVSRLP